MPKFEGYFPRATKTKQISQPQPRFFYKIIIVYAVMRARYLKREQRHKSNLFWLNAHNVIQISQNKLAVTTIGENVNNLVVQDPG